MKGVLRRWGREGIVVVARVDEGKERVSGMRRSKIVVSLFS